MLRRGCGWRRQCGAEGGREAVIERWEEEEHSLPLPHTAAGDGVLTRPPPPRVRRDEAEDCDVRTLYTVR